MIFIQNSTGSRRLGVKFKAEKPIAIEAGVNKGGYTIYFTDPDGITLELISAPPENANGL